MSAYDSYRHEEFVQLRELPSRIIEMAQTEAFNKVGYPVHADREVENYLDVMQELRFEQYFGALGGMTHAEFVLFCDIHKAIEARIKPTRLPCAAFLPALIPARYIQHYFPAAGAGSRLIVEIGPGSGYLSVLLGLLNYNVDMVEVAPAFVAAQMWMQQMFPNARVNTLPWWDWYTQHRQRNFSQGITCIVSNHCLNELHINALLYNIQIAKKRLAPGGLWFAEQLGSPIHRTDQQTLYLIQQAGFRISQRGSLWTFAPAQSETTDIDTEIAIGDRSVTWEHILEYFEGKPPMTEDEKLLSFIHRGK